MVTFAGAVCQPRYLEAVVMNQSLRLDFNYKGFVGGVPAKHRKIRRENPAGARCVFLTNAPGSGVCSFVVLDGAVV